MWQLSVKGPVGEIYSMLNQKFWDEHVSVEINEKTIQKPGMRNPTRFGARTKTEEGVSEQFRTVLKAIQGMYPVLSGNVQVDCGGEPGGSIWMKVEVV